MPQPQQEPGWIESLLQPLFDRLGLNGNDKLKPMNPNAAKPKKKPLTDEQLKAMGYSDSDIAAVRRWEAQNNQ